MDVIKLLKKLTFFKSSAAYKGKVLIISSLFEIIKLAILVSFSMEQLMDLSY